MAEGSAPLQFQQQENKSQSLLCRVVHMLHSPGPPASSKVSQSLKTGCPCLSTADVLIWVLCVGGCLVHQRMFDSTADLYLLNASSVILSQSCDNKDFFRHRQMPPEEQNCPQLRPTAFRSWKTSAYRNGIQTISG